MSIKRFTNFKAPVNTKQRLDEGVPAGQPDPKSDDPTDPTVIISGFGTMLFSQLKYDVEQKLLDLYKRAKRGDFAAAWHQMAKGKDQILPHKLQAIKDVEEAMDGKVWKRRITMFKKGKK
jgi:hypothetical protein